MRSYIPRPFQEPTHPLVNDTDQDGMLDGWEMQVQSEKITLTLIVFGLLQVRGIYQTVFHLRPITALRVPADICGLTL